MNGAREPEPLGARSVLGSRLAWWLAAGGALSLPLPSGLRPTFLVLFNLALALGFLWDRQRLLGAQLRFRRRFPAPRVRQATPYTLEILLQRGPKLTLRIEEPEPPLTRVNLAPAEVRLAPGTRAELSGSITVERHGRVRWPGVAVRSETRLGLCAVIARAQEADELCVYPVLRELTRGLVRAAPRLLGQAPAALRHVAQGGEIERLREYVATDSMRSLDWKASAKRHRPITRTYQPERNQTLWIVLDASRVMTLPSARPSSDATPHTRFEAALEAALALADVALREGDRVGLLAFASRTLACVAPRAGRAQLLSLLQHSLALHAEPSALDAGALLARLTRCAPRRSLVVLFSDLDNDADLRELAAHTTALSRHVTMCVSLTAEELLAQQRRAIERERDVFEKLAAVSLVEQRAALARILHGAGLEVLESPLPQLAPRIVQRYRTAKQAGRI